MEGARLRWGHCGAFHLEIDQGLKIENGFQICGINVATLYGRKYLFRDAGRLFQEDPFRSEELSSSDGSGGEDEEET